MNYNKKNEAEKTAWVFTARTVAVFVVASLITGAVLWGLVPKKASLSVEEKSLAEFRTKYSYISPYRPLIKDKDLIVNVQDLRTYLKNLPLNNSSWAEMSIYLEVLSTGANITVNPDLKIWPASLSKLPLGMVVMKKVENGDMRLDQSIHLESADLDGLTEEAFNDPSKTSFTVEYLMTEMLQNSSNVAYRALKRQITPEEQKTIVESVGLDELFDNDGKVSSKDYSRLFRALYLASYLNVGHSQKLLDLLASGNHETLLKSGIPPEVNFAHKWGTNIAINVYSDAGIVYLEDRPYLISVMISAKNLTTEEAETRVNKLMDEISRKAYTFMSEGYLQ